jgi:multiple sugar transport system substrate-binding protein
VQVQFAKLAPGQLYTAQSAALSSGSGAYDLVGWFANLAFLENGWLWSVDDLQQNEKLTDPSLLALGDFFPHFLDVFRSHGKLWGLPLYGESLLLYYNRSELKSVGVTAAPNTVAALDQVCKLITDAGRMAGIAMRGTVQNADVYNFLAWLYGFGGSWIDSQTMEVGLGQPEAVAAATSWGHFMRDYGPPDVANYYWTDVLAALAHQRAAIVLDSSGFGPSLEDRTQSAVAGNVGYAPLPEQVGPDKAPLGPRATNGRLGYSCAPYALSVARSSKQPEAAWLFLQWATSPPVLLASSQRTRHADAPRQSVVASPRFAEQYGYAQGAYVRQLGQSFSMAMPGYWPLVATGTDLTAALGQALTQIVTNQATPRDALAAAQEASVQIQQQAGLLK